MQITCDFGPCAAIEYPYVSVEVGHWDIVSKPRSRVESSSFVEKDTPWRAINVSGT
jgi:hypothetical protein